VADGVTVVTAASMAVAGTTRTPVAVTDVVAAKAAVPDWDPPPADFTKTLNVWNVVDAEAVAVRVPVALELANCCDAAR
jgi:hypothetical protein